MMATISAITDKMGVATLTAGERECLRLVGKLQSSKQIARILGISPHTVDQRMRVACRKLNASTRTEAALTLAKYEALNSSEWSDPLPPPIAERAQNRPAMPQLVRGERSHETFINRPNSAAAYRQATNYGWKDRFGLPFPHAGRTRNDLTILQSIVWLLAISASAIMLFILILASLVGISQLT